jgi:hypothetical protein
MKNPSSMLQLEKYLRYIFAMFCMLSVSSCKILPSKAKKNTSFKENIYIKKIISTARNYTGVP